MDTVGHAEDGIRTSVRGFLTTSALPLSGLASFEDEDSFLEKGILDSTGVLELVGYVEKEFGIRVEADEIVPDNLDSVAKLVKFIRAKTVKAGS
ncbi:MAG TPA: acyl carrier protein [Candidatus Aminicenantes bacterium]|nr:acyl carrier protein [Candidatus Aminicenantes bacterium]HRY64880.1 acyl carrier protein [Candidatus Aminicenantes bacterium]HRZ71793.1 acyl carrier protein [Candidatus Aminicenantes bacterium]